MACTMIQSRYRILFQLLWTYRALVYDIKCVASFTFADYEVVSMVIVLAKETNKKKDRRNLKK